MIKFNIKSIQIALISLLFLLCVLFYLVGGSILTFSKNLNNYNAHIFYYNWYGNPQVDNIYRHWNHDVLPHWSDKTWDNLPPYDGKENIGANFYPKLGTYSSNDSTIIENHMKMILQSGVGTISVSWWGVESFEDLNVKLIMNLADKYNLKINFHIEPVPKRTAITTIKMVKYLIDTYGDHNAFYRYKNKPLFYVYDSYLIPSEDWSEVLHPQGGKSIRNSKYDSNFIGLWVEEKDSLFFKNSGFDGFYTYFASDGFTYGSSTVNWNSLSEWAKKNNKIFIPSIGPGYNDERVRPWNKVNLKRREEGIYYDNMFKSALQTQPEILSITSFNEWHEGTQIEPAISKKHKNFTYDDYEPRGPDYYLNRTKYWINKY